MRGFSTAEFEERVRKARELMQKKIWRCSSLRRNITFAILPVLIPIFGRAQLVHGFYYCL